MTEPIPVAAIDPEMRHAKPRIGAVALALSSQAETRRLVRELGSGGVPVLLLKGPDLQQRLYGTPAAYVSGDVDVLIPRTAAKRARAILERAGWRFEPENGFLWRLSAAATFERQGFRADVHWGIHAAHLPAWSLRRLERALWKGASVGSSGAREPPPESLFVFLAVHAAGHRFERREWTRNVELAAAGVRDWGQVWWLARDARLTEAVRSAMRPHRPGHTTPLLDGLTGRAIWYGTYVARGHVIPRSVRDQLRERVARYREGYGWRAGAPRIVQFENLSLQVDPGVFAPQSVSAGIVHLAQQLRSDVERPVIAEVGTGCGAVSFLASTRWPAAEIHATDVSARAIACARRNAARLGAASIVFTQGHLLDALPHGLHGRVDLLFSNLPYVSGYWGKDTGGWTVPIETIYGPDPDGLGLMRELADRATFLLRKGGYWIFQLGDNEWDYFADYLRGMGFEPVVPKERRPDRAMIGAARLVERSDA
jgi:methylase of polypeptide subunit release factors